MRFRKIIAAALALTVVCGANMSLRGYVLTNQVTAIAEGVYYEALLEDITIDGIRYLIYEEHVEALAGNELKGEVEIRSEVEGNSVTRIAAYGFRRQTELTGIKIPDTVRCIDPDAFCECSNLLSVTIPESVTVINPYAFENCSSLTSITILNPKCIIYENNEQTICNDSSHFTGKYDENNMGIYETIYNGVIRGYDNSTAQEYAEVNGYTFESLGASPVTTTTSTTTTITTTTSAATTTTTTTVTIPAKEVSFGDPTGDGKIDANDASFTLVEYAKVSTGGESALTSEETAAADVNKDGKVDAKDASAILAYYSYLSTGGTDTLEAFLKPKEE